MKDIVSVVLIGSTPKPRTYKRIAVLQQISKVNLLCWDRMNDTRLKIDRDVDYPIYVHEIKAANDPLKRMGPYMQFTKKALKQLEEIQPDLIHVEGLDMLRIADTYKRKSKKKVIVVYEVPDLRRLITEPQKGLVKNAAKFYVTSLEKTLCNRADLIIMTSEMFYETHYKGMVDRSKFIYIPNVPEFKAFTDFHKYDGGEYVIGWIGGVRYKEQMKMMLKASEQLGCKVLVAGYEKEPVEIEPICKEMPNVEWTGMYDYNRDVATLYGKCSVVYAVYDANMVNEQIALPNKLYEAVYCELPIIVSKGTYLAKVVEDWGVGLVVDCTNQEEITVALKKLRDNKELYEGFVKQCRAHRQDLNLEKYNEELKAAINRMFRLKKVQ